MAWNLKKRKFRNETCFNSLSSGIFFSSHGQSEGFGEGFFFSFLPFKEVVVQMVVKIIQDCFFFLNCLYSKVLQIPIPDKYPQLKIGP